VSYGRTAITFHWAAALLVIWVGALGLMHDSWPKGTQVFWINIHALFGLALWVLVMARYWWRVKHAPPEFPANVGAFYPRLSRAAHLTMYALLLVTPIIGIVTFIWHARELDLGFFQINFGVAKNRAVFGPTEDIHGYLAYALFALAGAHILAVLWHRFVKHDGVLQRMWPSAAPSAASRAAQTVE
jgi:cytochrome b561